MLYLGNIVVASESNRHVVVLSTYIRVSQKKDVIPAKNVETLGYVHLNFVLIKSNIIK